MFEVTKWLGGRLRRYQQCISDLLFKDAPQRIASLLLQLLAQLPEYQQRNAVATPYEIAPFLAQKDLATLCGVSRQTLSTILSRWQRDGIVEVRRRGLVVKDVKALEKLAGEQKTSE